jgi:hypothetical protein
MDKQKHLLTSEVGRRPAKVMLEPTWKDRWAFSVCQGILTCGRALRHVRFLTGTKAAHFFV